MTAPDFTADELVELGRIHDRGNPISTLNALETAYLSLSVPACAHCGLKPRMRPAHGTAWVLEHVHEAACIELEDLD